MFIPLQQKLKFLAIMLLIPVLSVFAQESELKQNPQAPEIMVTDDLILEDPIDVLNNSIENIKVEHNLFSKQLIIPLTELGLLLQTQDKHEEAIKAFKRAQYILHRNFGVLDISQASIIYAIIDSQIALNHFQKANQLRLLILKTYQHHYGKENIKMVPALLELGQSYIKVHAWRRARKSYTEARDIVKNSVGADSTEMIPALRGIAVSYQFQEITHFKEGIKVHEEIVAIVDSKENFDPQKKVYIHLQLADWYLASGESKKAWKEYQRAWQLSQLPNAAVRDWKAYFAKPVMINPGRSLPPELLIEAKVTNNAYYVFEVTILKSGRSSDIKIVGTNLPKWTRRMAILAFKAAYFRPALVNGEAVESRNQKIQRRYSAPPAGTQRGSFRFGVRKHTL